MRKIVCRYINKKLWNFGKKAWHQAFPAEIDIQ